MEKDQNPHIQNQTFQDALNALQDSESISATPVLASAPALAELKAAGTSHVYADTADWEEFNALVKIEEGKIIREIDGNTANQPLVAKVLDRYLSKSQPSEWVQLLRLQKKDAPLSQLLPWLYTIVCWRIGHDFLRTFASRRSWEISLQIHMELIDDPEAIKQVARSLRRMIPSAIIKVPFAPHVPSCILVARDLESEGIPVNFTSTFSARQAVAAALLADVTRTNIFMGRLDQGLHAELLGAHVDLEAQRHLRRLRIDPGIKTQLIVASVRRWESLVETAGCDVYTAPCKVLGEFLEFYNADPVSISSRLTTSYEDRLGISPEISGKIEEERIGRLYKVEPEFIEFLLEYRGTPEFQQLHHGDQLVRRFEEAGFEDFFRHPAKSEWEVIRKGKLPNLDAPSTKTQALDTLFSLHADGDFSNYQEQMDEMILNRVGTAEASTKV